MSKEINKYFYNNLNFDKFLQAHKRAKTNKSYKSEVISFELNLEANILNLIRKIKSKTYHLGNYYTFKIYEPKEREIKALPYIDRVVHQWYIHEFIKPTIVPKFIYASFACLDNKGTHKAVEYVQKSLRIFKRTYGDSFWILKCDIKKFFYNINPNILFSIMQKYIKDTDLLEFTKLLIFDNLEENTVGIPIGNYTSQFFANIYLNELDNYVKRFLKIKYYARYMDDFIILAKTKKECIYIKAKIEKFLKDKLQLNLNEKSRYYPSSMGVNFCGYRIFSTHLLLRLSSKKKIKKKIKGWNYSYKKGNLDMSHTLQSINSWVAHSSHCNAFKLKHKVLNSCNFLLNDTFYNSIENNLIALIENDKSGINNF